MAGRLALLMLGCCVFGTWTMADARFSAVIQSDTMVIQDEGEAVQVSQKSPSAQQPDDNSIGGEPKNQQSEGPAHDRGALAAITDKFSIAGVLVGAYQYQNLSGPPGIEDKGGGAVAFYPEISFNLGETEQIFAGFAFAAGNGLNDDTPFPFEPWGAPLEDTVQDINGRNRSYLLTAWYKHTFQFGETNLLGVTGGVIDATAYLDENAYSNDEFTQFMNAALVNAPNAFIPSYDIGGAVEWEYGPLAAKGVIMRIGENDDGNAYTFYGTQVGYNLSTPLGEGNYRITFNFSSKDFLDSSGTSEEARRCLLLSFDQQLGENFGAWIRFGVQDDSAATKFKAIYSGGINISGRLWGRENDNIGIGYAYLKGGNLEFDRTHVAEAYARFALTRILALTLDVQYEDDKYVSSAGQGPNGWTYGTRLVAEF